MSNKRLFSKTISESDAFLDMPLSAQALYFHLGMATDDDGFVGNPKRTQRLIGCNDDDLKVLIGKRFVLTFPSGVVVVKHHRINNKWDRHNCKRTTYLEEFDLLYIKENKAYTLDETQGVPVQSEYSLGSVSKVKESKLKENKRITPNSPSSEITPSLEEPKKPKGKKLQFTERDMESADLLASLIKRNYPDWEMKGTREAWADHINRIVRLDKRNHEQIDFMIKWVSNDEFWRKNILSTEKLREKFNQLIPVCQEDVGKKVRNANKPKTA